MDSLPYEIQKLIISYVNKNSNIICSFVCKSWKLILKDIYKQKIFNLNGIQNNSCSCNMVDIQNDSYLFDTCCDKYKLTDICKKLIISKIYSRNCLNRIALKIINSYHLIVDKHIVNLILLQNCVINNVSKPDYIKKLLKIVFISNNILDNMLNASLIHSSFDMADFYIAMGGLPNSWIEYISNRSDTENEYVKIVKELEYLIKNNVINLPYYYLTLKKNTNINHYDRLLKHIEPYVSDNIKQYL